jgi:hypothetical protein
LALLGGFHAEHDRHVRDLSAGSTVVSMSHPRPHSVADLGCPALVNIERNLAGLRDSKDLQSALAVELNDADSMYPTASDRARRVRAAAVRDVDLHGWAVTTTADLQGLAVTHGEYTVSIMLGRRLTEYLEHGFAARHGPRSAPAGYG